MSTDLTILCSVFCVAAIIVVSLLCIAIWDFVGWKIGQKRPRIVGKKGQGGPFTLLLILSFVTGIAINSDAGSIVLKNQVIYGGFSLYRPESVSIVNCTFSGAGIVIYGGGTPLGATIDIERNHFSNCLCAIQLDGVIYDPHVTIAANQIDGDSAHIHNDQISIYQSSGSEVRSIMIRGNYLYWPSNAPIVPLAGGIVLDSGSAYTIVSGNVAINVPIAAAWSAGGITNVITGNTVMGQGPSGAWSSGMGLVPRAGYMMGNVVGWINSVGGSVNNFAVDGGNLGELGGWNANLGLADITDQTEQVLYWSWANQRVAEDAWPVGAQ